MNNIKFGQYYNANSIIHRLDPRIKLISMILFMVGIFLVPMNNFYILGSIFVFTFICILLTKVPLLRYLKSIKNIMVLLFVTFVLQSMFNKSDNILFYYDLNLTIVNIIIVSLILILFLVFFKFLRFRFLLFIVLFVLSIYILGYPIYGDTLTTTSVHIYKEGLIYAIFIILRILTLIMFCNILTLTTKSTDLNNALEYLLKPLEKLHIKVSIFSMMISIALRFIPTLFLEMDKILKAQASRGVDYNEGGFRQKIRQIVSILVPMFVVSFKRADDLSIAMEARGYIPGEKRTKLNILKMHFIDYLVLFFFIIMLSLLIVLRILL